MKRIDILEALVRNFYESNEATWIPSWTEYLYKNHIFAVAKVAEELSNEFGVNPEFSVAASLLHDIADAILPRDHPEHMIQSEKIAGELLTQAGFIDNEIAIIVGDIIHNHSCRDGVKPSSMEGKIMTSADAIFHLVSDFYEFAIPQMIIRGQSREDIKSWGIPKIERDFFVKICFDEVRERYRDDYARCKKLLESL